MPYHSISDLPKSQVSRYDRHQKEAFLKAFNHAYHEYHGDHSRAFAVAHHAAEQAGSREAAGARPGRTRAEPRGTARESSRGAPARTARKAAGQVGRINVNDASADELMDLDGVGEGTARRIVEYRSRHGRFHDVDDLDQVPGIGEGMLRRVRGRLVT